MHVTPSDRVAMIEAPGALRRLPFSELFTRGSRHARAEQAARAGHRGRH